MAGPHAVSAELNSINIQRTATAATAPQQEHVVQTAAGAVGTLHAQRQRHVLVQANQVLGQHVLADINTEL